MLSEIPGVAVFLDDIRIYGKNLEKHFELCLELVLKRLSEYNVRINKDKCVFLKDRIIYCGYEIGKDGIRKKKQKIHAVQMPKPDNIIKLRASD